MCSSDLDVAERAQALKATLAALVQADADAYAVVSAAYKLPKETPVQQAARDAAIQAALMHAAAVPLESATAATDVAILAATCAEKGNSNAASDAGVAALLAEAACRGAAYNVRINVSAMSDKAAGAPLAAEAVRLVARASEAAQRATAAVERQIG